jgi:hypothetical protein
VVESESRAKKCMEESEKRGIFSGFEVRKRGRNIEKGDEEKEQEQREIGSKKRPSDSRGNKLWTRGEFGEPVNVVEEGEVSRDVLHEVLGE